MDCSGKVVTVDKEIANVRVRQDACDQCRSCVLYPRKTKGNVVVRALNTHGAEVGDEVSLSVSGRKVIWASAVLFLIPLCGLLSGYFIGAYLVSLAVSWSPEALGVIFAFTFLAISYYPVRLLGKRTSFEFVIDSIAPTGVEPPGLADDHKS